MISHSLPMKNGDFPSFLVCFPSKSPRSPPNPGPPLLRCESCVTVAGSGLLGGCWWMVVGWYFDIFERHTLTYWCVLRREWMGCWGLLGLLIGIVDHSRVEIPGCTLYNPQNDFGGFLIVLEVHNAKRWFSNLVSVIFKTAGGPELWKLKFWTCRSAKRSRPILPIFFSGSNVFETLQSALMVFLRAFPIIQSHAGGLASWQVPKVQEEKGAGATLGSLEIRPLCQSYNK